jgi:hypothetical protein
LGVLSILVLGGGLWSVFGAIGRAMSSPARHSIRLIIERPLLALGALAAALGMVLAAGWWTQLRERINTTLIEGGTGCLVVEPNGRSYVVASSPNVVSYDARLICPSKTAPSRKHRAVVSQMMGRALPTPELPSEEASPTSTDSAATSPSAPVVLAVTGRARRIANWRSKGTGTHMGIEGKPRPLREAADDFEEDEVWLGTYRCTLEFDGDGDPSYARNCRGKSDARTARPVNSPLTCRTTADRVRTRCWSQPFENGIGPNAEKGQFRLWLPHERNGSDNGGKQ